MHVSTLARLFDAIGYPNPDDPDGGVGPGGPYVHRFLWALLNPQPLPPKVRGRNVFGPQPEPWRNLAVSAIVADRVLGMVRVAEGFQVPRESVVNQIQEFVDAICPDPPRPRWPFPWPGPWPFGVGDPAERFVVQPADLILIGVQLFRAADLLTDSQYASSLVEAGDKIAQTGLERLTGLAQTAKAG